MADEREVIKEKQKQFVTRVKKAFAEYKISLEEDVIEKALFEGRCTPMNCTTTCAAGCTIYCSTGTH